MKKTKFLLIGLFFFIFLITNKPNIDKQKQIVVNNCEALANPKKPDDYGCMHITTKEVCWRFPEMTVYGQKVWL